MVFTFQKLLDSCFLCSLLPFITYYSSYIMASVLRPRSSVIKPLTSSLATRSRLASTVSNPALPQITTLPNKLRVVTEATPGHFHAVGVYVDAGSRYESSRNSGISHLMDRLAFKVCPPRCFGAT